MTDSREVISRRVVSLVLMLGAVAVTVVGADFDADGHADLAIGVSWEDVGAIVGAGAVNVLYGSENGITSAADLLLVQDDLDEVGETYDEFGHALAAGDFNSDGAVDLAIGVPHEGIGNADSCGAVHIVYGFEGIGLTTDDIQFWHQGSPGIDGALEEGDRFGNALAVADFDGDGYDDLAVGVEGEAIGDISGAGAVNVIYGGPDGLSATGNQMFWEGENGLAGDPGVNQWFGWELSAGDFDADGFDDLAISIIFEEVAGIFAAGRVVVLYGTSTGLSTAGSQSWAQGIDGVPNEYEEGDAFGSASISGDFNGDGFADLGISAVGETWGTEVNTGSVVVLFGSQDGLTATGAEYWLDGLHEGGDQYGSDLASGDLNGDGYDELIVGIPFEDLGTIEDCGAFEVLYGSPGGLVSRFPEDDWHQNRANVLDEAEQNDFFGYALAAGDFDDDGFVDVAVGVLGEDVDAIADAGAVQILYGSAAGLTGSGSQFWHQNVAGVDGSAEEGDGFGNALAAIPRSRAIFADGFEMGDLSWWSGSGP